MSPAIMSPGRTVWNLPPLILHPFNERVPPAALLENSKAALMLADPPVFELLAEEFLRNYHRYADSLYRCYMESQPHQAISSTNFRFDLYASGEYSRMLETQWDAR